MKKVAIPTKGDMIDSHFGHCEKFTIYTLSDKDEIIGTSEFRGPESCGCKSNLAYDLKEQGVSVLLAGGMGQGAINKLKECGIESFIGFSGAVKDVLEKWLGGNLGNFSVCNAHANGDHNCSH
ncbi:NifB/NifX family molybdenum-iron cluster-binding protein [Plebeiibacterium marinum]|uniref:NifB/NifX family molybdenum-iron cluster-binding protein n=1 Tax=Plebeiibacterium marinum TaxID=2992111 RepID=A0AAE3MBW9_9BACT|nr:NifB/NifX family molybdenum-iron cluster-binding protein [Plebeiobacterium marinum]MCW3804687.1 NifB/NifX family molybdenum-iron cluster-binding protein [Plebeiobacterium marinum]